MTTSYVRVALKFLSYVRVALKFLSYVRVALKFLSYVRVALKFLSYVRVALKFLSYKTIKADVKMILSPGNIFSAMTSSFILVTWLAAAAESSLHPVDRLDLSSLLTKCLSVEEGYSRIRTNSPYLSQSTPLTDEVSSTAPDCRDVIKKYLIEVYNLQMGFEAAPRSHAPRAPVIKRLRPIDPDTIEFGEGTNRQVEELKLKAGDTEYWRTLVNYMDVMRKRSRPDIDLVLSKAGIRLQATDLKAEQEDDLDNTGYEVGSEKHLKISPDYEPEKTLEMTSSNRAHLQPFLDIKTSKRNNFSTEHLLKSISEMVLGHQVNKMNRQRSKIIDAMYRDGK
ncbi:hypothetical protein Btru_058770 [Bulinus truncatus]|nr:hypothetical protein Btru_058770 [Bulinus truncatus]